MFDRSAYNKAYRVLHREKLNQNSRDHHRVHKEEDNENARQYHQENKVRIYRQRDLKTPEEKDAYAKELAETRHFRYDDPNYIEAQRQNKHKQDKIRRDAIKKEVLTHYGNGKLTCVKCGFSNIHALSIDHIKGGGVAHRRAVGGDIYLWLRRYHYPDDYQTLCMNCQYIKRAEEKECPGNTGEGPMPNKYGTNHIHKKHRRGNRNPNMKKIPMAPVALKLL